ncbi:MAG TPA: MFS transporter [Candidatus Acidoferrales bacterium]|nr:MFS transporter [Candidatus Acidoferrales bacterium]
MSFGQRLADIRSGFASSFWVANISELFERLGFYGQQASLALFLIEILHFTPVVQGELMGWFGLAVYALPVFVGALADRLGFRRALMLAYLFAAAGYFLLGSLSASWMGPVRSSLPTYWLVFAILMLTALGPSLVKPSVLGTVALSSGEKVRSIGYSIYYTLVNIGGAAGPLIAGEVHRRYGVDAVFRVSALSVLLMFFLILFAFREPPRQKGTSVPTAGQALANMLLVLRNWRFALFLFIFSGYWVMFYAYFVAMPAYIANYVDPHANIERLLAVDALMIIFFQIVVSYLTRNIRPFPAIIIGSILAVISMVVVSLYPSVWSVVVALVIFSVGEMTQAPRYYEYVSRLAPPGQQGVFMGFAFLPIALGYFISGQLSGRLVHYYGDVVRRPKEMWYVLAGIGAVTTVALWLYNLILKPSDAPAATPST